MQHWTLQLVFWLLVLSTLNVNDGHKRSPNVINCSVTFYLENKHEQVNTKGSEQDVPRHRCPLGATWKRNLSDWSWAHGKMINKSESMFESMKMSGRRERHRNIRHFYGAKR